MTSHEIAQLAMAQHDITHTIDGPITAFVLISRAIELARNNDKYSTECLSDALWNSLDAWGFLDDQD
jgi:hypothetical protein